MSQCLMLVIMVDLGMIRGRKDAFSIIWQNTELLIFLIAIINF